jgi:hypothetical protein
MKMPVIALTLSLAAPAAAFSQPYASAKIAYAGADFPLGSPYNGVIDDNSPGLGVDFGFGFGRHWALEIGAARYGSFDGSGSPCAAGDVCTLVIRPIEGNDVTLYNAALVPRFTAGDARFFARVGYYRANVDTDIGIPGADDFHEDGLLLGAGVRWYFEDPWSISLEATRFDDNIRQIAVGVGWGLRRLDE